jgi:hypothetical protein
VPERVQKEFFLVKKIVAYNFFACKYALVRLFCGKIVAGSRKIIDFLITD